MIRKHTTCSVALLLTALACAAGFLTHPLRAFSPYSWATYYAPKRAHTITVDGDLSDWSDVKGFTMDQEKFFFVGQGMSSAKWKGPADLSATFKVQWDEQYIYIAVEVLDDVVTEPHGSLVKGTETGSWDDDGVELMFDNDGCGMSRYYIGDTMHHEFHFVYSSRRPFVFDNFWKKQPGAPQPLFTLPDGSTEPLAYPGEVMVKNEITDVFPKPPYNGAYAFRRTAKGYNLEVRMSLPGATMAAINEGGHPIGFDIAINDNDTGKGPLKQQLHWSGMNGMFWRDCQLFGTLILLNK
ncbi:MAG: sugar-binding protein [Terriglobia bacterium]|jgi:hypothetical protein